MPENFSKFAAVRNAFCGLVVAFGISVYQHELHADEPSSEHKLNSMVADELRAEAIAEMRFREVLLQPTVIEFIETPLIDVMDFLEDQHGIQIEIETAALDAIGLASQTPVTRNLKGISLKSALNLILNDMELTYIIQDEVLQITTRESAELTVVTRVYNVADLLDDHQEIDELVEVVTLSTGAHAHEHESGTIVGFSKCLVATVPHGHQHKIARLLAFLRATQPVAQRRTRQNPLGLYPVNEKPLASKAKPKRAEKAKEPKTDEIADPFGEGVPAPSKRKPKSVPKSDPFGGGGDPSKIDPFGGGNRE